jgi:hypothetical protein
MATDAAVAYLVRLRAGGAMFLNHLYGDAEKPKQQCRRVHVAQHQTVSMKSSSPTLRASCPIYRCLGQRIGLASREGSQLDGYAIHGLLRAHQTAANSSYRHRFPTNDPTVHVGGREF